MGVTDLYFQGNNHPKKITTFDQYLRGGDLLLGLGRGFSAVFSLQPLGAIAMCGVKGPAEG